MGMPIGWTSLEPIDELVWLDWSVDPADVESDLTWPSPRAGNPGSRPNQKGGKILAEEAKKAERKWPTPIQGDAHLSSNPEVAQRRIDEGKITLSREVQRTWPTPSVMDVRTDIRKPSERSDKANKGGCSNLREHVTRAPSQGIIPRVAVGIKDRVNRLKGIGNAQVPQVAATAWEILNQ